MNCNVLVLGSSGDRHFKAVPLLKGNFNVIALDGRSTHAQEKFSDNYLPISAYLAEKSSCTVFTERKWTDCSSVLQPKSNLVEFFGLQEHYAVVSENRVNALGPEDFAKLLRDKCTDINVIKSDLEGLDLEFCIGLLQAFPNIDVVQLELRANPFHHSERSLGDALISMNLQGFMALSINSEHWKSPKSTKISKKGGIVAHSDVVFVREELFSDTTSYPSWRICNAVFSLLFLRQYVSAEILLNQNRQEIDNNLYRRISASLIVIRFYAMFSAIIYPIRLLKRFIKPNKYMRHVLKN